MAQIISFYNNKGGVSKTTTLFNLAVYLTHHAGKKVLIADCDPQCNATELFFASNPAFDDPDQELPGTSIYDALKPRFEGEVRQIDAEKVNLAENTKYDNLFLLRGDLSFALAEGYLATAWSQAVTENVHEKNTYLALYRLLKGLGDLHEFDYVLCDIGPSTGAISKFVVLACDGIFLPMTPDRFCNQAVRLLAQVLQDWVTRHAEIAKTFEAFRLKPFKGRPMVLGAIIQNFKTYGSSVKKSYAKWQERISVNIQQYLIDGRPTDIAPSLKKSGNPFVATIRDVGPLAPIAQMHGRAIFDVQREHTRDASTTGSAYQGAVWKNWEERKVEYLREMQKISKALL